MDKKALDSFEEMMDPCTLHSIMFSPTDSNVVAVTGGDTLELFDIRDLEEYVIGLMRLNRYQIMSFSVYYHTDVCIRLLSRKVLSPRMLVSIRKGLVCFALFLDHLRQCLICQSSLILLTLSKNRRV